MKKYLIIAAILLLAAACAKQAPIQSGQDQPAQNQATSTKDNSAKQTETYLNPQYKVSLNYSGLPVQAEKVSSYIPAESFLTEQSNILLTLFVKPSTYVGTNLEAAWFNLSVGQANQSACYKHINTDGTNVYSTFQLNKIRKVMRNEWHYTEPHPISGAGLGHTASGELYRLYKNNICYEVVLGASDYNRQNLEKPDSVKEYNAKQIFNNLGGVFNRLEID